MLEPLEKSFKYEQKAKEYMSNAQKLLGERKLTKAGEFLWGAIAELVKAISVLSGRPPISHKEVIDAGKHMALQLNDKEMFKLLDRSAQALHANFYEDFLSEDAFSEHYSAVLILLEKLERVLAKERLKLYPSSSS